MRGYTAEAGCFLRRARDAIANSSGDLLVLSVSVGVPDAAAASQALTRFLDPHQRARHDAYRCTRAGAEHLLGLALARIGVATLAGVALSDVSFDRSAAGKPWVTGPRCARSVGFNISHSDGLVLCALRRGGAIGVDIERGTRLLDTGLAARYFAPAECHEMARTPIAELDRWLLRQWTLKEAYLKATGEGLSRDLASFSVEPHQGAYRIAEAEGWRLRAFDDEQAIWSLAWRGEVRGIELLALD